MLEVTVKSQMNTKGIKNKNVFCVLSDIHSLHNLSELIEVPTPEPSLQILIRSSWDNDCRKKKWGDFHVVVDN